MFRENLHFAQSRQVLEDVPLLGPRELSDQNSIYKIGSEIFSALNELSTIVSTEDFTIREESIALFHKAVNKMQSYSLDLNTTRSKETTFIKQLLADREMLVKLDGTIHKLLKHLPLEADESLPSNKHEIQWLAAEYQHLLMPKFRSKAEKKITHILIESNRRI